MYLGGETTRRGLVLALGGGGVIGRRVVCVRVVSTFHLGWRVVGMLKSGWVGELRGDQVAS